MHGLLFQSHLTATLLASILGAVLGPLQIGYHTGNVNAPARVRGRADDSICLLASTYFTKGS